MILERLLHRIASCSLRRWRRQHGPKSPPRLHSTSDRNCTTPFHNKLNHLMDPWRIKLSHVIQRAHSYHTVPSLKVMERFGRAAFLSGTTYGVVSTVLLVFSRRNAMFCLAMSCPIKQHHGRYSQSAARVLKTRCGGALQPRKCQWREIQSQFDSGTVPHQLENNSQTILHAKQRFPFKKQEKTQKHHAQTDQ